MGGRVSDNHTGGEACIQNSCQLDSVEKRKTDIVAEFLKKILR